MIQKIKNYLLIIATGMTFFTPTVAMVGVANAADSTHPADCTGIAIPLANGANAALTNNNPAGGGGANCEETGTGDDSIMKLAARITNTFSIIVGAASVIMIIYGGFRYVTSGGESGRVGAAKNALLYAIVGLVIVAIAQLIVHFVLSQSTQLNAGG